MHGRLRIGTSQGSGVSGGADGEEVAVCFGRGAGVVWGVRTGWHWVSGQVAARTEGEEQSAHCVAVLAGEVWRRARVGKCERRAFS